jgi:hypothetical protein
MAAFCKWCDAEITFDDEHISERTGRKIPLDVDTDKPHNCPIWKLHHRIYHEYRKGCGSQIFFDEDRRSPSGKMIPIDKYTDEPHECEKWIPIDKETEEPHNCE